MNTDFGKNLKRERIAAGMSQKELAAKVGTTQQLLSRWELGEVEPTLGNIIALLKVLNVTFEDLIDMENADDQSEKRKTE